MEKTKKCLELTLQVLEDRSSALMTFEKMELGSCGGGNCGGCCSSSSSCSSSG